MPCDGMVRSASQASRRILRLFIALLARCRSVNPNSDGHLAPNLHFHGDLIPMTSVPVRREEGPVSISSTHNCACEGRLTAASRLHG